MVVPKAPTKGPCWLDHHSRRWLLSHVIDNLFLKLHNFLESNWGDSKTVIKWTLSFSILSVKIFLAWLVSYSYLDLKLMFLHRLHQSSIFFSVYTKLPITKWVLLWKEWWSKGHLFKLIPNYICNGAEKHGTGKIGKIEQREKETLCVTGINGFQM